MTLLKLDRVHAGWFWGVGACLTACLVLAGMFRTAVHEVTHDPRRPIGEPPPDLAAEPVEFLSRWNLRLEGWFVEGTPGGGAVVLMHPIRADRRTMIPRARLLAEAGYSVLLFDFRGHGESEGDEITFGLEESVDAKAAVRLLRKLKPRERIGAIGVSLGGAACLVGPGPVDVDALVVEAVYPDIRAALRNRLEIRFGAAAGWLTPLISPVLERMLDIDPQRLRPIDSIGRARCPVLVLSGSDDRRTDESETRALFDAAPEPKELWIVPGAAHEDLYRYAPDEYRDRVLDFLDRTLRR